MQATKRTTYLSSNVGRGCEHCGHSIGALSQGDVADSVNHYIQEHGYRLLHVGTETTHDSNGKPWHTTVVILGHDDPPAIRPPAQIVIGGIEPPAVK
jgi:hypothetical protein